MHMIRNNAKEETIQTEDMLDKDVWTEATPFTPFGLSLTIVTEAGLRISAICFARGVWSASKVIFRNHGLLM